MFEEFSRGYYLGRLYVEPHDAEEPVIHDHEYQRLHDDIYQGKDETPLVFKLENQHITVQGDESVPSKTLGLPTKLVDELDVDNPPSIENVLLAKRGHAEKVLELLGRRLS